MFFSKACYLQLLLIVDYLTRVSIGVLKWETLCYVRNNVRKDIGMLAAHYLDIPIAISLSLTDSCTRKNRAVCTAKGFHSLNIAA